MHGTRAVSRSPSVNAPATFTLRWLLPRLAKFRADHPDMNVDAILQALFRAPRRQELRRDGFARPCSLAQTRSAVTHRVHATKPADRTTSYVLAAPRQTRESSRADGAGSDTRD